MLFIISNLNNNLIKSFLKKKKKKKNQKTAFTKEQNLKLVEDLPYTQ